MGIDERAERGVNLNHQPDPDGPDAAWKEHGFHENHGR